MLTEFSACLDDEFTQVASRCFAAARDGKIRFLTVYPARRLVPRAEATIFLPRPAIS